MVQATGGHREALGPGSAPYSRVPIGSLCASLRQLDAPLSISISLLRWFLNVFAPYSIADEAKSGDQVPSPKTWCCAEG